MPPLNSALRYTDKHLKILPLHTVDSTGACTYGRVDCPSPGKHPRISNGVKGASCDPEQIGTWWSTWPDSNIGMALGSDAYDGAGLMCLDIDMPDGPESLAILADEGKTVPSTLMQQTGGGGIHYFFKVPDDEPVKNIVGLRKGIDVKADGGYSVVDPSRHQSGTSVLSGKFAVLIRNGFSSSVRRATQECRESFEEAQQSCRRKDARSSGVNFPDSALDTPGARIGSLSQWCRTGCFRR